MPKIRPFVIACAVVLPALLLQNPVWAQPKALSATAQGGMAQGRTGFDGVVEAVRQTVVAAQVTGAVVELAVKAGDRVQAGQLLLRIDARAADQSAAASDAQVQAARASQEVAAREYQRQQQLFQKKYISQAALDRAESEFKATRAQTNAQVAQAGAARTQTGFHTVRAPYAGVVSDVPVALGDMAMPGKTLLALYDPSLLRVTAAVPQSVAAGGVPLEAVRVELPSFSAARQWPSASKVQVLPTVDAATHTVQIRAELAAGLGLQGIAPGMFARLWLPVVGSGASGASGADTGGGKGVSVPLASIVRRAEMTGVYVPGEGGKPLLRQVRLGRIEGDRVEVLTGIAPGEQVIADPHTAARIR